MINVENDRSFKLWILEKLSFISFSRSLSGDFIEEYEMIHSSKGSIYANAWFWIQISISLPKLIRKTINNGTSMLQNYFKTALRNIIRKKSHSAINIFGLSIGIALSILIFLFVRNEFSYDSFHKNGDRVFQVTRKITRPGRDVSLTGDTPFPLAEMMKEKIADIEFASRLTSEEVFVKIENEIFKQKIHVADQDFLDILTFEAIHGDLQNALIKKNSIILTRKMSEKYFEEENPVGKTLELIYENESYIFNITAVVEDFPKETSFNLDFLMNTEYLFDWWGLWLNSYTANNPATFIRINETSTEEALRSKLNIAEEVLNAAYENSVVELSVIPLEDIHLTPEYENEHVSVSDPIYSYLLSGLGLLVLIIACVNYILLSVGRASTRAKEIGIRKVVGAFRSQLKKQYIGEAVLTSLFALGAGIVITLTVLPVFNELAGKHLEFHADVLTILSMGSLIVIVGITAGIYPAFLLAGFNPVTVLKGRVRLGSNNYFGKSLVILQFSITIFLLITTLFMRSQIEYMNTKDIGYNKEQVVIHPMFTTEDNHESIFNRYKDEVQKNPKITSVTAQSEDFGMRWTKIGFYIENNILRDYFVNVVDPDYLSTMGIELKMGRDFSKEHGTEKERSFIVNEAFVEYFGLDDPLNSVLPKDNLKDKVIIGVMEDFNFHSLHQQVGPLAIATSYHALMDLSNLTYGSGSFPLVYNVAVIRIDKGETLRTMKLIEDTWKKIAPDKIFEPQFLDETVQEQYVSENRWLKIINYTSLIAIFIACLGLLGLSTISVENRIKEIGIRKILGASSGKLVGILSKEFILLVIASNVIAWPMAYYLISRWLQNFAFSMEIDFNSFILASIAALAIAFVTISFRTIKAANSNPSDALRYE